jgi:dienelactone hydrolase
VRRNITKLLAICIIAMLMSRVVVAEALIEIKATQPHTAENIYLKAELFKPEGAGRFPAVVLMHGCGGWQPAVRYGLQAHARFLQQRGFVVLNLDSFGPRHNSGGKVCASLSELSKARSYRTHDAFDALRYLQAQSFVDPDNIFLIGQSNGGSVAIRAAQDKTLEKYSKNGDAFRGIVAYYPWCGELGGSSVSLASPLLIFAGGKDDWVPAKECKGKNATGAELQVTIYPEAAHSFDLDIMQQKYLGKQIGGDPVAARDSREKMLAFFVNNLTGDIKQQYALANQQLAGF